MCEGFKLRIPPPEWFLQLRHRLGSPLAVDRLGLTRSTAATERPVRLAVAVTARGGPPAGRCQPVPVSVWTTDSPGCGPKSGLGRGRCGATLAGSGARRATEVGREHWHPILPA